MSQWSIGDWQYVERQIVTDPKGRKWSVALMDVLGQAGDPEVPNTLLELQYAAGRYFTIVYSTSGTVQFERGYPALAEARRAYETLLGEVFDGTLDPSTPVYREGLEG